MIGFESNVLNSPPETSLRRANSKNTPPSANSSLSSHKNTSPSARVSHTTIKRTDSEMSRFKKDAETLLDLPNATKQSIQNNFKLACQELIINDAKRIGNTGQKIELLQHIINKVATIGFTPDDNPTSGKDTFIHLLIDTLTVLGQADSSRQLRKAASHADEFKILSTKYSEIVNHLQSFQDMPGSTLCESNTNDDSKTALNGKNLIVASLATIKSTMLTNPTPFNNGLNNALSKPLTNMWYHLNKLTISFENGPNTETLTGTQAFAKLIKTQLNVIDSPMFSSIISGIDFPTTASDVETPYLFEQSDIIPANLAEFKGLLFNFKSSIKAPDLKVLLTKYEETHGIEDTCLLIAELIDTATHPSSRQEASFIRSLKKLLNKPEMLQELTNFTITKYIQTLSPATLANSSLDYISHVNTLSVYPATSEPVTPKKPSIIQTSLSEHIDHLSLTEKNAQFEKVSLQITENSALFTPKTIALILSEHVNKIGLALFTSPPVDFEAQIEDLFTTWASINGTNSPSVHNLITHAKTYHETNMLLSALSNIEIGVDDPLASTKRRLKGEFQLAADSKLISLGLKKVTIHTTFINEQIKLTTAHKDKLSSQTKDTLSAESSNLKSATNITAFHAPEKKPQFTEIFNTGIATRYLFKNITLQHPAAKAWNVTEKTRQKNNAETVLSILKENNYINQDGTLGEATENWIQTNLSQSFKENRIDLDLEQKTVENIAFLIREYAYYISNFNTIGAGKKDDIERILDTFNLDRQGPPLSLWPQTETAQIEKAQIIYRLLEFASSNGTKKINLDRESEKSKNLMPHTLSLSEIIIDAEFLSPNSPQETKTSLQALLLEQAKGRLKVLEQLEKASLTELPLLIEKKLIETNDQISAIKLLIKNKNASYLKAKDCEGIVDTSEKKESVFESFATAASLEGQLSTLTQLQTQLQVKKQSLPNLQSSGSTVLSLSEWIDTVTNTIANQKIKQMELFIKESESYSESTYSEQILNQTRKTLLEKLDANFSENEDYLKIKDLFKSPQFNTQFLEALASRTTDGNEMGANRENAIYKSGDDETGFVTCPANENILETIIFDILTTHPFTLNGESKPIANWIVDFGIELADPSDITSETKQLMGLLKNVLKNCIFQLSCFAEEATKVGTSWEVDKKNAYKFNFKQETLSTLYINNVSKITVSESDISLFLDIFLKDNFHAQRQTIISEFTAILDATPVHNFSFTNNFMLPLLQRVLSTISNPILDLIQAEQKLMFGPKRQKEAFSNPILVEHETVLKVLKPLLLKLSILPITDANSEPIIGLIKNIETIYPSVTNADMKALTTELEQRTNDIYLPEQNRAKSDVGKLKIQQMMKKQEENKYRLPANRLWGKANSTLNEINSYITRLENLSELDDIEDTHMTKFTPLFEATLEKLSELKLALEETISLTKASHTAVNGQYIPNDESYALIPAETGEELKKHLQNFKRLKETLSTTQKEILSNDFVPNPVAGPHEENTPEIEHQFKCLNEQLIETFKTNKFPEILSYTPTPGEQSFQTFIQRSRAILLTSGEGEDDSLLLHATGLLSTLKDIETIRKTEAMLQQASAIIDPNSQENKDIVALSNQIDTLEGEIIILDADDIDYLTTLQDKQDEIDTHRIRIFQLDAVLSQNKKDVHDLTNKLQPMYISGLSSFLNTFPDYVETPNLSENQETLVQTAIDALKDSITDRLTTIKEEGVDLGFHDLLQSYTNQKDTESIDAYDTLLAEKQEILSKLTLEELVLTCQNKKQTTDEIKPMHVDLLLSRFFIDKRLLTNADEIIESGLSTLFQLSKWKKDELNANPTTQANNQALNAKIMDVLPKILINLTEAIEEACTNENGFLPDKFMQITTGINTIASAFNNNQKEVIHNYLNSIIIDKIYSSTSERLDFLNKKLTRRALHALSSDAQKENLPVDDNSFRLSTFSAEIFQQLLTEPMITPSQFVSDDLFTRALETKIPDPSASHQDLSDQLTCKEWLRKCHIFVPTNDDASIVTPSLYLNQTAKNATDLENVKNFYGDDEIERTENMRISHISMSSNLKEDLLLSSSLAKSLANQQRATNSPIKPVAKSHSPSISSSRSIGSEDGSKNTITASPITNPFSRWNHALAEDEISMASTHSGGSQRASVYHQNQVPGLRRTPHYPSASSSYYSQQGFSAQSQLRPYGGGSRQFETPGSTNRLSSVTSQTGKNKVRRYGSGKY
ncbi:hypothetical protein HOG98_08240 [bacterium]|jgi:hypothetical protein|nr:hypothetical protein [bacterium]